MKIEKFKIDPRSKMTAIRQIRGELEITQEEMARRLDMRPRNYGRWERGEHSPTKGIVKIIKNLVVVIKPLGLGIADIPDDIV